MGLMIFPRNALTSGPGTAWNAIAFSPTWRKVKVGKPTRKNGKLDFFRQCF
jgi:hypothetical protein